MTQSPNQTAFTKPFIQPHTQLRHMSQLQPLVSSHQLDLKSSFFLFSVSNCLVSRSTLKTIQVKMNLVFILVYSKTYWLWRLKWFQLQRPVCSDSHSSRHHDKNISHSISATIALKTKTSGKKQLSLFELHWKQIKTEVEDFTNSVHEFKFHFVNRYGKLVLKHLLVVMVNMVPAPKRSLFWLLPVTQHETLQQ